MSETVKIARQVIELIKSGKSVAHTQNELEIIPERWFAVSSKAHSLFIADAIKERDEYLTKSNVSGTSNKEIQRILELNSTLADYALLLPTLSTMPLFNYVETLAESLPESEVQIVELVANATMGPKLRVMQKKGRFEKLEVFKPFNKIIEASILCYYRRNYISCFLTLSPVIEGVLLRWTGYHGAGKKPEFDDHRRFFKNSQMRQPCPSNPLFHNVYVKACDKILNNHLFKPSQHGTAHSEFNRHLAAHLLYDSDFATRANCIRLFLLLDTMTEIYLYESRQPDLRFSLHPEDYEEDALAYANLMLDEEIKDSPEKKMLLS